MESTDDLVEEAASLRGRYDAEVEEITGAGYDEEIERARLGVVYAEYREQMDGLREKFDKADQASRLARGRDAFGVDDLRHTSTDPAVHIVSYRDALVRASGIFEEKGAEARALRPLDQAAVIGDEVLARAIAVTAFRRGARDVVEAYEALHPGWTERAVAAREDKRLTNLAAAVRFRLPKPAGLPVAKDLAAANKRLAGLLDAAEEKRKSRPGASGWQA